MLHSRQPVYYKLIHFFFIQAHIRELFLEEALGINSGDAEARGKIKAGLAVYGVPEKVPVVRAVCFVKKRSVRIGSYVPAVVILRISR